MTGVQTRPKGGFVQSQRAYIFQYSQKQPVSISFITRILTNSHWLNETKRQKKSKQQKSKQNDAMESLITSIQRMSIIVNIISLIIHCHCRRWKQEQVFVFVVTVMLNVQLLNVAPWKRVFITAGSYGFSIYFSMDGNTVFSSDLLVSVSYFVFDTDNIWHYQE